MRKLLMTCVTALTLCATGLAVSPTAHAQSLSSRENEVRSSGDKLFEAATIGMYFLRCYNSETNPNRDKEKWLAWLVSGADQLWGTRAYGKAVEEVAAAAKINGGKGFEAFCETMRQSSEEVYQQLPYGTRRLLELGLL